MNIELLNQRYLNELEKFYTKNIVTDNFYYDGKFTGNDKINIEKAINIFKGKEWNQVEFHSINPEFIFFIPLNTNGMIYYLPAFLKNFYNLKLENILWFSNFIEDLERGFFKSAKNLDEFNEKKSNAKIKFQEFEKLTIEQSKMVSIFLVNVANLSKNEYCSSLAQKALTSYWGNFLLF